MDFVHADKLRGGRGMNKQTKHEVDKEAKKIAQEEISHEIGMIRTQLNEITNSLQQQPINSFNPNELIQQIQQFFEESQQQLQQMNQRLTDFVEKATPLLNQSIQQAEKQNMAMSQQPYSQFGHGQMQPFNTHMEQMSHPIPQQSYGQNQLFNQNQLIQHTPQARINPVFHNVSGQGQMNFQQPYSYGAQTPYHYGSGAINNQNQTTQPFQNQDF